MESPDSDLVPKLPATRPSRVAPTPAHSPPRAMLGVSLDSFRFAQTYRYLAAVYVHGGESMGHARSWKGLKVRPPFASDSLVGAASRRLHRNAGSPPCFLPLRQGGGRKPVRQPESPRDLAHRALEPVGKSPSASLPHAHRRRCTVAHFESSATCSPCMPRRCAARVVSAMGTSGSRCSAGPTGTDCTS